MSPSVLVSAATAVTSAVVDIANGKKKHGETQRITQRIKDRDSRDSRDSQRVSNKDQDPQDQDPRDSRRDSKQIQHMQKLESGPVSVVIDSTVPVELVPLLSKFITQFAFFVLVLTCSNSINSLVDSVIGHDIRLRIKYMVFVFMFTLLFVIVFVHIAHAQQRT